MRWATTCTGTCRTISIPHNFFGNSNNVFPNMVSVNMLCVHKSVPQNVNNFEPVEVRPAASHGLPAQRAPQAAAGCKSPMVRLGILDRRRRHVHRLLRPPARRPLAHYKLLSSGVTKGAVGRGSIATTDRRSGSQRPIRTISGPAIDCGCSTRGGQRRRRVDGARDSIARRRHSHWPSRCRRCRRPGSRYELSSGEEAPIVAIRYLLGLRLDEPIPPVVRAAGHDARHQRPAHAPRRADGLRHDPRLRRHPAIGYQNRPRLFDLAIRKPAPLFAAVVEIDERIDADGRRAAGARSGDSSRAAGGTAAAGHRVAGHLPAARLRARRPRTARRANRPRAGLRRDQRLQPASRR